MSDSNKNKQPKKSQNPEAAKQNQENLPKPEAITATATAKAKLEGKKGALKAGAKTNLASLKAQMSSGTKPAPTPNTGVLKLTTDDKSKLGSALNLTGLINLNSSQILRKIRNLSIKKLEQAEEARAGAGARMFAMLQSIENGETKYKPTPLGYKFKTGDKMKIHFRKNGEAENNYGMRTLFKKQPEVRQVMLTQNSSRGKGKSGLATRKTLNGDFFFTDGSYAPIFTSTALEIKKVWTPKELSDYKKTAIAYKVGNKTRSISTRDQAFYRKHYAFRAPKPGDANASREYWRRIDGAQQKPKDPNEGKKAPPRTKEAYVPKTELQKQFYAKWQEIMSIKDTQKLIDMKDEIVLRSNDPIVKIPGETKRLRTGAALRWALFKRHAELKGYRAIVSSGLRRAKHQQKLWYRGLSRRMRKMRNKYPNASESEIERRATSLNARYVARHGAVGTNQGSHHQTGGALDLRIYDQSGKKIEQYKFKRENSRTQYNHALRTGDISALSAHNKKAMRARLFLDQELMASHFLGVNYINETWHWNLDKDPSTGSYIYKNV